MAGVKEAELMGAGNLMFYSMKCENFSERGKGIFVKELNRFNFTMYELLTNEHFKTGRDMGQALGCDLTKKEMKNDPIYKLFFTDDKV